MVLSHNHYDHTSSASLAALYSKQPKGSIAFFAPLGNLSWFKSIGFSDEHVTELDWWDKRNVEITLDGKDGIGVKQTVEVTCTPCQHFTGRGIFDRFKTLWASWAVRDVSSDTNAKVWFGGDTGYRSVANGFKGDETTLPHCPAFKEIGEHFGGFDLAVRILSSHLRAF